MRHARTDELTTTAGRDGSGTEKRGRWNLFNGMNIEGAGSFMRIWEACFLLMRPEVSSLYSSHISHIRIVTRQIVRSGPIEDERDLLNLPLIKHVQTPPNQLRLGKERPGN